MMTEKTTGVIKMLHLIKRFIIFVNENAFLYEKKMYIHSRL